ncbi:uncharacterized protein LOC126581497 [Anopheles aquasalis]|uniref:uncharacterized protein LOC126581497 n=1 Tax=Anopheles aquasalis TaxID=42839 RepID=UPI00215B5EBB|nr:uncharacterized protein LOC126581497 [Anopheles aquasalis]
MVYSRRKRGRQSRADEREEQNGAPEEKSPVSQVKELQEEEEEVVPVAAIPDSLQTLLETLTQQAALIVEQNTRIEQRLTCLEQGLSRIDQQNGLIELQNDRIEQQIVRIEQRTITLEEKLNHFSSTPVPTVNESGPAEDAGSPECTPEKSQTTKASGATDKSAASNEPFSIKPATTGEELYELDVKLGDAAYYAQAAKWIDWNVFQQTAKARMDRTMDLLISRDLQLKCYWNSHQNYAMAPLLKFRKNILKLIQDIGSTEWKTATADSVNTFVVTKLRNIKKNKPRPPTAGVRKTVNSCDESSIELDDDTSIDSSSIDLGDNDDESKELQQQEQTCEIQEEKLIEEELYTGNEDDTSIDLDDLDSIDDELDEIEFE